MSHQDCRCHRRGNPAERDGQSDGAGIIRGAEAKETKKQNIFPEKQGKYGGEFKMMTFGALLGSLELGMIYAVLALGVFLILSNLKHARSDGGRFHRHRHGNLGSHLQEAGIRFLRFGAFAGGCLAGLLTGLLHTRLKIQAILAGILVMMAPIR